MRRVRVGLGLVACLVTAGAANAQATAGRFEFSWSAPETCPTGAKIEQQVERILNRPISVRADEVLNVRALVVQPEREQPWRVELQIDNGQRRSSRAVEAASCDELASVTALLVAMLIEPHVEHAEPDVAAAQPPPAKKKAAATPEPAAEVRSVPAPGSPVQAGLGAFAGAGKGALPAWSFGTGLDGGLAWRALRLNVEAAYWSPVDQTAPDNPTQGARFRLLSGGAELCAVQPIVEQRVFGGICSGAELSLLRARGFGPGVLSKAQQANFFSVSAGVWLGWAASSRLLLVVDADALLPVGDRVFVFEGSAPASIYTPGFGVQLALGAQFLLGRTEKRALGPTTSSR